MVIKIKRSYLDPAIIAYHFLGAWLIMTIMIEFLLAQHYSWLRARAINYNSQTNDYTAVACMATQQRALWKPSEKAKVILQRLHPNVSKEKLSKPPMVLLIFVIEAVTGQN